MNQQHFILNGHEAVPVSMMEWATWLQANQEKRIVKKTEVNGAEVSTVFLGLNHQWGDGPPHIFETLVFAGPMDGEMDRYSTWDEAEAGHAAMVKRVAAAQPAAPR